MQDLRRILSDTRLADLRAAYEPNVMRAAMLQTIVEGYPPLDEWNRSIASTFYGETSPISPRDRERCLVALLSQTGQRLSLAIHVYWGLMEGLNVAEVCHSVGLAACYGGVPRLADGLPVIDRVLQVLQQLDGDLGSSTVLRSILRSFVGSS